MKHLLPHSSFNTPWARRAGAMGEASLVACGPRPCFSVLLAHR
jgi:hypothetical protein